MTKRQIQISKGDKSPNIQSERDTYINSTVLNIPWKWLFVSILLIVSIIMIVAYLVSVPNEILEITSIERVYEAPIELSETYVTGEQTGLLSVYWKLLLSNNGKSDLSVIDYDVTHVSDENFAFLDYTGLQQGLYILNDDGLSKVDLPLNISAGQTEAIYLKTGILISPSIYPVVKEQLSQKPTLTLKGLTDYLHKNGSDFYGNVVEALAPGIFSFPICGEAQAREQVFNVWFKTAREFEVNENISWYTYSVCRELGY